MINYTYNALANDRCIITPIVYQPIYSSLSTGWFLPNGVTYLALYATAWIVMIIAILIKSATHAVVLRRNADQVINKLVQLYPVSQRQYAKLMLEITSKIGVIAGGSVVYGLLDCPSRPVPQPSDIDIFVMADSKTPNNQTTHFKQVLAVVKAFFPSAVFNCYEFNQTRGYSIITITIENCPTVQVIAAKDQSVATVLGSFDFDYVQCGIHNSQVYLTLEASTAHQTNQVNQVFFSDIDSCRFIKAVKKGFSTPIFTDFLGDKCQTAPSLVPVAYQDLMERDMFPCLKQISYMRNRDEQPPRLHQAIAIEQLCITGITRNASDCTALFNLSSSTTPDLSARYVTIAMDIERVTDLKKKADSLDEKEFVVVRQDGLNTDILTKVFKYITIRPDAIRQATQPITGKYVALVYCNAITKCLTLTVQELFPYDNSTGASVQQIPIADTLESTF